jgi:sRNA-binding regulator protein Hfq
MRSMNETKYLDELITKEQLVMIRLLEGRDISAVPIAHDQVAVIIKNIHSGNTSLIYKKAISVITPLGG